MVSWPRGSLAVNSTPAEKGRSSQSIPVWGLATVVARTDGVEYHISCGFGAWPKRRAAFGSFSEQPLAASGAWTGDDTYVAKICLYETPFIFTAHLKFSGDEVRCDVEANIGFGPLKQAQLVGKVK